MTSLLCLRPPFWVHPSAWVDHKSRALLGWFIFMGHGGTNTRVRVQKRMGLYRNRYRYHIRVIEVAYSGSAARHQVTSSRHKEPGHVCLNLVWALRHRFSLGEWNKVTQTRTDNLPCTFFIPVLRFFMPGICKSGAVPLADNSLASIVVLAVTLGRKS